MMYLLVESVQSTELLHRRCCSAQLQETVFSPIAGSQNILPSHKLAALYNIMILESFTFYNSFHSTFSTLHQRYQFIKAITDSLIKNISQNLMNTHISSVAKVKIVSLCQAIKYLTKNDIVH